MRTVVLDLETKKLFEEVENGKHSLLGVSVVGIHDSETGFSTFFEDELSSLWPILESAELVVGFNIKKFDWAVLQPYYPGNVHILPTLDLLDVVRDTIGFRIKLDHLAKATLGQGKLGTGLDAYRYWKAGDLESLKKYCLWDVAVTRDLYLYAKEHGILKYPDLGGATKEFKFDLANWMPKKTENIKQQMRLGV